MGSTPLMVPPIRTALANNPDGSPMTSTAPNGGPITTEKQWWFYWRDLGNQVNAGMTKLAGLITYGNHADRPVIESVPDGALYTEIDRGDVVYQSLDGRWLYVTGTMFGTLTPDQRPTDLGAPDAGFDFRTSVPPARQFIWSGGMWVEVTPPPNNTIQVAYSTAPLTLTTTPQNVPGCVLTLANAGKYLIQGVFDFSASGDAAFLFGGLTGSTPLAAFLASTGSGRATATQQWVITATAGATAQLNAYKAGGTGSSQASTQSSISALWVSP